MKRFVITQRLCDAGMKLLEGKAEYRIVNAKNPQDFEEDMHWADGLLIKTGKMSREDIMAFPNIKVIGRHGVGFDTVDAAAAAEQGIPVIYTPGANARSVAEHTLALILAARKKLSEGSDCVLHNNWNGRNSFMTHEFLGACVGFIGFGNIGHQIADMCMKIGMTATVYDPYVDDEKLLEAGCTPAHSVEEILKICDIVSVHVPLTRETENMIAWNELNIMKPDALLINCARGGIINETDLARALREGIIGGAALDVFSGEVPEKDSPLLGAPNLICTPHNAARTYEAEENICRMMIDGCLSVLEGKKWPYVADRSVYEHLKWKNAPWA